ncbi:wee1-like protein kinase, partial [Camellia sinensis]|uniref:wee1-like protein kinase n=1 Tax=Camellia sinensis TaxID=4442 RepID=UPI001036AAA3
TPVAHEPLKIHPLRKTRAILNFIYSTLLFFSPPQIPKISGEREREREERMKGSVARHLTVQKLGHVSFKPLQQSSFSISLSDSFRFQSLLESEAQSADSIIPSSSPPLDIDIDSNVDDKDFILSQDFFCTPDYITPDGQYISNSLDCNKENIACPKSPEKIKTVKSKRQRQDGFNLSCHEQVVELAKDTFGTDEINTEKAIGTEPQSVCFQQIGNGNFSCVFKVLKRIDGCFYAVKKSTRLLHQDTERRKALMEVQALAALGFHENIVGYYSSWFENEQLFIQMELCDHSLSIRKPSKLSTEGEVLEIIYQIAKALQFIHEKGIAHLDVKPDNIYIKNGVYKLGDFGCATLLDSTLPIEEGDARYMPQEILNDNYDHLDKVDIFSLGAAIYELIRGSALPESGYLSLNLREGKLPLLPSHSVQFQNLLKAMIDPDPVRRPSAKELVKNPIFDRDQRTGKNHYS